MLSQKNISHVFVGAKTALSTGAASALTAGQIGVFVDGATTAQNTVLTTGERFQVLMKDSSGNIVNSPWIDFNNITGKSATNYTAPTEKLVYVGYNGTSGSLAVNNSSVYTMHMNLQDGSKTFGEHPYFKMVAAYKSDATATQTEIADALVVNAVKNFEREVAKGIDYIAVGRINSAAVTAGNALDNNATVVNRSNTVTVATAVNYATGTALAVGDYLRIGGVGAGTALTSQVYKVTAINSLVVTLDRPVLEASGTYATASDDIEVIPAANVANWGLSFKGKPLAFEAGLKAYRKVDFDVQLSEGFGTTPITVSTEASKGEGTYYQVAENEWLLKGNRGETYRVADYPLTNTLNAVSGQTYDTVVVSFTNNNSIQIDHEVKSYITLVFYVATDTAGTSGSTAYTNLKSVFGL